MYRLTQVLRLAIVRARPQKNPVPRKNVVLNLYSLAADGTSYSEEFAAFLKEVVGYLPDNGPLSGAVLKG